MDGVIRVDVIVPVSHGRWQWHGAIVQFVFSILGVVLEGKCHDSVVTSCMTGILVS